MDTTVECHNEEALIFEEIMRPSMSDRLYEMMGSTSLETIWNAVRCEVLPQLVSHDYYMVPFIQEARSYNIFNVFLKTYRVRVNILSFNIASIVLRSRISKCKDPPPIFLLPRQPRYVILFEIQNGGYGVLIFSGVQNAVLFAIRKQHIPKKIANVKLVS